MNGKLRLALVTGAATIVGMLSLPGAALAVTTTTHTQVISTPDDTVGSGPWARDTFERTTTVQSTDTGFKIQISDIGTFVTPTGVKGTVTGHGTFIVTGGTYNSDAKELLDDKTLDRSGVAVKDSFTGQWWSRFVDGGASAGIEPWSWTYKSVCWDPKLVEVHTESSANGSAGDRPSKVCPPEPKPTATVKPTPTKTHPTGKPTWTHKPTVSPSVSVTPTATKTATAKPTTASPTTGAPATTTEQTPGPAVPAGNDSDLPKTGPSVGILIGGALILSGLGGGLWYATRRRKVEFTA